MASAYVFPLPRSMDAKEGVGTIGWIGEPNIQIGEIQPGSPAQACWPETRRFVPEH